MKKKYGISLIESLIIAAVFLLILVVCVIVISQISRESRDVKRVSDMEVLRSAMANIKIQFGGYDQAGCEIGAINLCVNSNLQRVMPTISNFKDPRGQTLCSYDCTKPCQYSFTYVNDENFEVLFFLEKGIGNFPDPGCYLLTAGGVNKK